MLESGQLPNAHSPQKLLKGALAGVIATIPMTCLLGTIDTSADDELVTNLVRRTGYPLDADGRLLATFVSRFAFGAGAGLLFAVGRNHFTRIPPVLRAPSFALGLWALTSIGKRAATRPRPTHGQDEAILFSSHLVWGVALGRLIEASGRDIAFGIWSGVAGRGDIARSVRNFVS